MSFSKMFTSSKKTQIFALVTLATTFVYYRFNSPSDERVHFQIDLDGRLTDLTVPAADFQKLLQEQRKTDELEHQSSQENPSNNEEEKGDQKLNYENEPEVIEQEESLEVNQETNTSVSFVEHATSPVTDEQISEQRSSNANPINKQEELGESPTKNNHKSRAEELDMIVVNNIVYHKNDTIPPKKQVKYPALRPSSGKVYKDFDFDDYKNRDRKFLKERIKEMVKRSKLIAKVCKARSKLIAPQMLHLVWDQTHTPNLVWCPLYKVASTSWMINFLRLAHFNEDNPKLKGLKPKLKERKRFQTKFGAGQNTVYKLYPPPVDTEARLQVYKSSLRVIIVRHPFTRILSAYRDKMTKLEPAPPEFNFRNLQLQIIAKYRPVDSSEMSPFPTFPEFVQYILDSTKTYTTAKDWNLNVHCWTPYWAQCNVCGADYNLILKLETMTQDERFLITVADLKELRELKSHEWRHLRNTTSTEVAPDFFRQLTRIQIKQLYQRYNLDFLLFGYSVDEIYNMEDE